MVGVHLGARRSWDARSTVNVLERDGHAVQRPFALALSVRCVTGFRCCEDRIVIQVNPRFELAVRLDSCQ